jgi:hypothetical protein
MAISPLKHFWGILRNVSLILGTIWIIIQIFAWLSKEKKYDIKVDGNHIEFILPDSIYKPLEYVNSNSFNTAVIAQKLKYPNWLKNSNLIDSVVKFAVGNFPEQPSRLTRLNSFWLFNIANNGDRQIADLYLETPFEGYYFIERPDSITTSISLNKAIKIGIIRPGNHLTIGCWSTSLDSWLDEKNTRLTFPEGTIKINYHVDAGQDEKLLYLNNIFIYIVSVSGILLIVYLIVVLIRHIGYSINKLRN